MKTETFRVVTEWKEEEKEEKDNCTRECLHMMSLLYVPWPCCLFIIYFFSLLCFALCLRVSWLRAVNLCSPLQLLKLETILYSSKAEAKDRMLLQDNYRATQPLNHRLVFTSFTAGWTDVVLTTCLHLKDNTRFSFWEKEKKCVKQLKKKTAINAVK